MVTNLYPLPSRYLLVLYMQLPGYFVNYCHFVKEVGSSERLSNLPKVTQLVKGQNQGFTTTPFPGLWEAKVMKGSQYRVHPAFREFIIWGAKRV